MGDTGDELTEARHFFAVDDLKLRSLEFFDTGGDLIHHRDKSTRHITQFIITTHGDGGKIGGMGFGIVVLKNLPGLQ